MKRVKMYKPLIQRKVINKKHVTVVVEKKHEEIGERGVMDRTLEQFESRGDDAIIEQGIYMEEVKEAPKKKGGRPKKVESESSNNDESSNED